MKPLFPRITMIFGVLFMVVGVFFMGMYFWEGVITRAGEPDQSPVFWYLPILFLGIGAIILGLLLCWQALRREK